LSNGTLYRWAPGSKVAVFAHGDRVELSSAVTKAIAAWNDVPQFGEFELTQATDLDRANVVVYDRADAVPLGEASCQFDPRGSGYTYFCLANGLVEFIPARSGDPTTIAILISVDRAQVGNQAEYDAVVAHEIGHALGIGGHSPVMTDVMYGDPRVATPSLRDRQTLQWVLGQPAAGLLR
jgi:predicted Zn-dependent protease